MEFKDSQTYKNIMTAYERDLDSSAKYKIFGEKARNEEYIQIGNIFDAISLHERAIAVRWRNIMNGDKEPSTLENIQEAIIVEQFEWNEMYVNYAKTAKDEGFDDIARLFEWVAKIEQHHEFILKTLDNNIKNNNVFCKDKKVVWICIRCGNLIFDLCAPDICPVCLYPKGFYELNCDNF